MISRDKVTFSRDFEIETEDITFDARLKLMAVTHINMSNVFGSDNSIEEVTEYAYNLCFHRLMDEMYLGIRKEVDVLNAMVRGEHDKEDVFKQLDKLRDMLRYNEALERST